MNTEKTPDKKKKLKFRSGHSSMTKRSLRKWSWLFIGPVFAAFLIGFVWPFAHGIFLSFNNFKII